jgi:hypothetical protein
MQKQTKKDNISYSINEEEFKDTVKKIFQLKSLKKTKKRPTKKTR